MEGTVFRSTGSWYDVRTADGTAYPCRAKGKLRLKGDRSTNPVSIGDRVDFALEEDGTGVVSRIHERQNRIVRRAVNLSRESHVVAANVDRAFLVVTVTRPATSSGFIDRFLVSADAFGVPVTLEVGNHDIPYYWDPIRRLFSPYSRYAAVEKMIERPLDIQGIAVIPLKTTARAQWRWN